MHDRHAGRPTDTARDDALSDFVINPHGVDAVELPPVAVLEHLAHGLEHLAEGLRTAGRASERLEGCPLGPYTAHVVHPSCVTRPGVVCGPYEVPQGLSPALTAVLDLIGPGPLVAVLRADQPGLNEVKEVCMVRVTDDVNLYRDDQLGEALEVPR